MNTSGLRSPSTHRLRRPIRAIAERTLGGRIRASFVVDPWAYLDSEGSLLDEYLGHPEPSWLSGIIRFGSTGPEGRPRTSDIGCWRRHRDKYSLTWKSCPGRLHITRDDVGRYPFDPRPGIWWVCSSCHLTGVIERWEGTPFDQRPRA